MFLRMLVIWLVPPDLTLVRWRRTCVVYSLAAGCLSGLVDLVMDADHKVPSADDLLIAFVIFVVASSFTSLAFMLGREVSLALGARMAASVEKAIVTGRLPQLGSSDDWPAFEQLRQGLYRLLVPREETIERQRNEIEYYRQLAEEMLGLELVFGLDHCLRWVNPGVFAMTGFSREECLAAADPFDLWIYGKDRPMLRALVERVIQGGAENDIELRVIRKDGSLFWCSCRCYLVRNDKGIPSGLRFSAQDIQPRKDADLKLLETVAALRRAQALKEHYLGRSNDEKMRLAALLEIVNLGILFIDRDRRVVYANQTFATMWKLGERGDVIGMRDDALLDVTGDMRIDNAAYLRHVHDVITQRSHDVRYDIACDGGRVIRERSSVVHASDGSDHPIGRVWIFEDITELLRTEERLTELAERDPLTSLYNRRRFHEDLTRQLAESARRGGHLGLVLFDLDDFNEINDRYGHAAGDEVLQRIAAEVPGILRRNELLFRLGSDEFAVITTQLATGDLSQLASRLVEKVSGLKFNFYGNDASMSVSVGIATTLLSGHRADALAQAADHAMGEAKRGGKNRWIMATRKPLLQEYR